MAPELLVVVDPWDNVRGSAPRERVHREGLWHRGVHVLLFNSSGQVLVQRRSARKPEYPNLVDCSVSEHLRPGETFRDAAYRGLREELSLHGIILETMVKFRMVYGRADNMVAEVYKGIWNVLPTGYQRDEVDRVAFEDVGNLLGHDAQLTPWLLEILRWMTKRPFAFTML